ncbi:MAG: threonine ammonia-lyase [Candidatus Thermoplasmatota archaeon]
MLTLKDISKAYDIIKPIVRHTPIEKSKTFSNLTKENVYLKLENLQTTGSFKIRGAYNKIYHLTENEKKRGVVCASAGNHAQGVAYASTLLHVKSTVFMPIYTPPTKIIATKSYGAKVILEGKTYDDAYLAAKEYATKNKMVLIPAFNDEYVIAGQGTIGIEIAEDLKKIDAIVVPVGGGGLISGIAIALKSLKDKVKVIGVEAEGAQSMKQSLEKKQIIPLKRMDTIADGIAVKTPGDITFDIAKKYVDEVVTVNDEEISDALYLLLQRAKLVVEPAGATSLAAILSKKVSLPGKNIVALISGGNINLSLLTQIIEQGMMKNKLLVKISIIVNDKPKFLKDILTILANIGANVQSISHDRGTTSVPVGYVKITITLQTLGEEQIKKIKQTFDKKNLKYQILH